jgi:hypothetical protein
MQIPDQLTSVISGSVLLCVSQSDRSERRIMIMNYLPLIAATSCFLFWRSPQKLNIARSAFD